MKRRIVNVFSLSFLDVMFCGFGAVILFFMIINADTQARRETANVTAQGEVQKLKTEVLEAEHALVELYNTRQAVEQQQVQAQGRSARVIEEIATQALQLSQQRSETLARQQAVDALKADLKSLEEANRRLQAGALQSDTSGMRLRTVAGQGQRQYLTGLKMDGERILILVDSSASMLADRIINVLRFRNLPAQERVRAAKWRQVLHTVEWITSRIPPTSQFQIYAFNETSIPLYQAPASTWLDGANVDHLEQAVQHMYEMAPANGTNLYQAFRAIEQLQPPPDTLYLLTDGLPTQGRSKSWGTKVSARARKKQFDAAREVLPAGIPVNIILFPMEGDPQASSEYWKLARATQGAFFSPSGDWP